LSQSPPKALDAIRPIAVEAGMSAYLFPDEVDSLEKDYHDWKNSMAH
jgi:hypothetical protein